MIFALLDYWHYRRRTGRFGETQRDGGMAMAFLGGVPTEVVADLWPGDLIFTQRLNAWFAWAQMYLTSSPIDHSAIYIGDGKIFHVTLAGSKVHSIKVFGKHCRVLPVRLEMKTKPVEDRKESKATEEAEELAEKSGRRPVPARLQLALVGVKIIFAIYPERFRWKFQADLVVLALLLDLLTFQLTRFPYHTVLAGAGVSVAAINVVRDWLKRHRNPEQKPFSHPDIVYRFFFNVGGLMFTSLGPLIVSPLGILPLKVFRGICEKYAESLSPSEYEAAKEDEDNFLIRWNEPNALYRSEDEDAQPSG